jgi:hypothetical protein
LSLKLGGIIRPQTHLETKVVGVLRHHDGTCDVRSHSRRRATLSQFGSLYGLAMQRDRLMR